MNVCMSGCEVISSESCDPSLRRLLHLSVQSRMGFIKQIHFLIFEFDLLTSVEVRRFLRKRPLADRRSATFRREICSSTENEQHKIKEDELLSLAEN